MDALRRRGLLAILLSALPLLLPRGLPAQALTNDSRIIVGSDRAAGPPHDLDDYVLLGVHEVDLGDGSYVAAGNVGVNVASGRLTFDKEVFVADGAAVAADVVALGKGSSVFDVFANRTVFDTVVVRGAGPTAFAPALVSLPPLPTFAPGTTPVALLFEETRVLAPGAYGAVLVGRKATLVLPGGTYELESLDVQAFAAVHVLGPATIDVRGDFKIAAFTHMGPARSGVGARDVRVNVGGRSVRFGSTSHAALDLFAPKAQILFSRSFRGEGRFVGDVIQGDETLNLRLTRPPGESTVDGDLCTRTQEDYGSASDSSPLATLVGQHPELFPVTIGAPGISSLTIRDAPRLACFLPATGVLASLCLRLPTACPVDTIVDACSSPPILDFNAAGDGSSGGQGAGAFAGEVLAAKVNVALSEHGLTRLGLTDFVLPTRLCTSRCPHGREVNPNPMKIQTDAVGVADGVTTVGDLIALADQALSIPHCRPGTCSATTATAILPPNPIRMSDVQTALQVVNQCFRGCATPIPCE